MEDALGRARQGHDQRRRLSHLSLAPFAKGHCVLVIKAMQNGAHTCAGEMAEFVLEPGLEERKATVPPELAKLLKQDRALACWFEAWSYSMRRFIGDAVRDPKARRRGSGRPNRWPNA
jgi:hypothetical protein